MEYHRDDIRTIAKQVLTEARKIADTASFILLSGELGAGKTALVQAIAQELGVLHSTPSPTFVVMRTYDIKDDVQWNTLVHIDAYRLEESGSEKILHLDDMVQDKKALVCIEWPERISGVEQYPHVRCTLRHISDEKRDITIGV